MSKFKEYLRQERELTPEEVIIINFAKEKFYEYCENPPSDLVGEELLYEYVNSQEIKKKVLNETYNKWKEFFDARKKSPEDFIKEKSTFFYDRVMNISKPAKDAKKMYLMFELDVLAAKGIAEDTYNMVKSRKMELGLNESEFDCESEL